MHHHARTSLILVGCTVLGIITHLIPHEMGISTVGAIGMLSAAYLPRYLIGVPALATVLVADAVNGFYAVLAMSFVYLAHVAAAYATRPILGVVKPSAVLGASLASAIVFYLLSHLTPMAMGYYPGTLEGWIACYVNGLPFLWRGVLANLLFGGCAFGVIWLVREIRADRFAAAERH